MSRPVTPSMNRSATGLGQPDSQPSHETAGTTAVDHIAGAPKDSSHLSQSVAGHHDGDLLHDGASGLSQSHTNVSQGDTMIPSRGGTLKKKASIKRGASLKRSGSRKSSYAGSVKSMQLGEKEKYEPGEEQNSAFYCPVPTSGSPTDVLADRFQAWRKVLKDLIVYFRDLQKANEVRAKSIISASNTLVNIQTPPNFLSTGGLADAQHILKNFHKLAQAESVKSRDLENEVILQLTGLRSDLQQKIKEIKSLSSDFKNSVAKEQEGTKKAVRALQDALGSVDLDAAGTSGKNDPFLIKMSVDRQLERQLEEENYLHRAYLNLEASGRELESIVVGEIQKAYHVLAGIMKREADVSYETTDKLKEGPLAISKAHEWDDFVTNSSSLVDPRIPLRRYEQITYPGKDHPAAIEVRAGMLERKSKYLKNYTPGWYVLSPTHLHEFKSADRISSQSPIMSLYLPEQKLGTHSERGSSSHKFMLKGRQTGAMHRGHSWIFRAETHDTMLQWYGDIKELTEKRGEERNAFIRQNHARTLSGSSMKAPSIRSHESGMEEDEIDRVPFSSEQSIRGQSIADQGGYDGSAPEALGVVGGAAVYGAIDDDRSEAGWRPPRPTPGGRFPSDINVQRGLQAPLSPSSGGSFDDNDRDRDTIAAAGALPGSDLPQMTSHQYVDTSHLQSGTKTDTRTHESGKARAGPATSASNTQSAGPTQQAVDQHNHPSVNRAVAQPNDGTFAHSNQVALTGATAGAHLYDRRPADPSGQERGRSRYQPDANGVTENVTNQTASGAIPAYGQSSPPIAVVDTAPETASTMPRAMHGRAVMDVSQPIVQPQVSTQPDRQDEKLMALAQPHDNIDQENPNKAIDVPTNVAKPHHTPSAATFKDTENMTKHGGATDQVGVSQAAPSQVLANAGVQEPHTTTSAASVSIYSTGPPVPTYAGLPPRDAAGDYPGSMSDSTTSPSQPSTAGGPSTTAATSNTTNGILDGIVLPERPAYRSAQSVTTIRDLHIPGEFPETPAGEYAPSS